MAAKKRDKDGKVAKHALDKDRSNKEVGYMRSAATVKRLRMYNSGGAVRNKQGKIISQELQSKELPSTRIVPDRRWFGNTRVIGQKQLDSFREQMADKADNPFTVLLRERKLPMQLLDDPEAKRDAKRKRKEVLQQHRFSETFGAKSGQRQKKPKLTVDDYEALVAAASNKQDDYGSKNEGSADAYALKHEHHFAPVRQRVLDKGQSKRIWGELYKVVDSSDVVIQVLDARDPEGTRCKFLEAHLRKNHKHKHMLFLLNKVDLVPQWNAKRWLHVLSQEYPVLAFHASLTNPFGKGALLSLLRQFARLHSDKKAISVGFIGYPNVGKSSVINTLRTKKVCTVAPVPGETKVWQYITLTKRVFLVDCPGIVYSETNDSEVDTVLKGVVRVEKLEDASVYIPAVLQRVKPEYLKRAYKLKAWTDHEDFLTQIAQATGKLTKGSEADVNTAAKMVLLDWQRGKLPFYSTPAGYPDDPPSSREENPVAQAPMQQSAVLGEDANHTEEAEAVQAREQAAAAMHEAALTATTDQQASRLPMCDVFPSQGLRQDAGASTSSRVVTEEDDERRCLSASDSGAGGAEHSCSGVRLQRELHDRPGGNDSGEGDDVLGSDEGGVCADRSTDANIGSSSSSDEDEEGGYGAGGLSWEAVMAQVMGKEAGSEDSGGHSGDEEERKQPPDTEGAGKSSGRHEGRKVGNQGRVRVPRRRRKQGK